MIVFSFLLVLAALGLLVVGLLGASQVLIWASIAASAVAGLCLVMAVLQQRRAGHHEPVDTPLGRPDFAADAPTTVIPPIAGEAVPASAGVPRSQTQEGQSAPDGPPGVGPEQPVQHQRSGDSGRAAAGADNGEPFVDPPDEPVEESVSASDVLRTADLSYDVLVIDGRPRYHLVDCPHVRSREPVSLPLAEAREAGFTPCSLCRPDSTLAARTRERFGD
ncbi:MAG TPA: hypothetical protein VFX70_08600 [Mycobacteriales bacterium]|nr:hypothetical protein [Mycobacteriales bacterium]